jgi:hypothetical protein
VKYLNNIAKMGNMKMLEIMGMQHGEMLLLDILNFSPTEVHIPHFGYIVEIFH